MFVEPPPVPFVTVEHPEAVRMLLDPSQLRLLEPLFRAELTAGEYARAIGLKPNTALVRLRRLCALGLVTVAREERRRGRPRKFYRTAAPEFFMPFAVTPWASFEDMMAAHALEHSADFFRSFARTVTRATPDPLGAVVRLFPDGSVKARLSPDGVRTLVLFGDDMPAVGYTFQYVRLAPEDAKEMQREQYELWRKYLGRQRGEQRYLFMLGLTPVAE